MSKSAAAAKKSAAAPTATETVSAVLRQHAEDQFRHELEALAAVDDRPRPPKWMLSPWAVATYVLGGKAGDATISPKYIGKRRVVEVAIATLATDRALLLLGVPGTAKSWLSEHLAAAISGNSTQVVQGTAGTSEEQVRYGWNYALLLAKGPSRDAIVPGPIMNAMGTGTILSEKSLPIPELGEHVQAAKGFNVIATANNRDKGVNDLSSALKRRFNTVILPVPDSAEEEVSIVQQRVASLGKALEIPGDVPRVDEIRRVVTIFRELRNGLTEDGKAKLKQPSGTLSTAEAISVVNSGMALAAHFGDGSIKASDLASGLVGAVIKDPVQDRVVWQEYLETVVKERDGWKDLYRACRETL
jgi:MoxR-like ATPase